MAIIVYLLNPIVFSRMNVLNLLIPGKIRASSFLTFFDLIKIECAKAFLSRIMEHTLGTVIQIFYSSLRTILLGLVTYSSVFVKTCGAHFAWNSYTAVYSSLCTLVHRQTCG
jgi:hypothetical protein